jgi:Cu(I)/Ag(I) efflux system membrane fusion protein
LSKDDLTAAKEATLECKGALDIIEIEDLDQEDLQNWHKLQPPIAEKLQSLFRLTELENFRKDFSDFSTRLTDFLHFYNSSLPHSVYRFHCPMAFDGKGADWIQSGKKTKNPYYGTKMLGCGDLEEIIGAKGE